MTPAGADPTTPSAEGGPLALEPAFSVKIGQNTLGTFTQCSGLAAEHETYSYPEGGNNLFVQTLVGRLRHPNVTLQGGLTDQSVLLDWLLGTGALGARRQDVIVTFHEPNGATLRRFYLVSAVPVRWSGPTGNASANAVATESLEIAHQGVLP
jgi:phage tail-like protein